MTFLSGLMQGEALPRGMAELQAELAAGRSLPPVERWTPEYCGQIDLRIARDGAWYYIGTPIARPALVRLFSTILRKEPDGRYCLVTPVEMAEITVEDAPFLAVQAQCKGEGQAADWSFLTNVGDTVTCDAGHCLRVIHNPETGEPRPYIHVRRGLEARVVRPVFYELVEAAIVTRIGDQDMLGIWSGGVFHALGEAPRDDA